jgi:hypothetical protein
VLLHLIGGGIRRAQTLSGCVRALTAPDFIGVGSFEWARHENGDANL